MASMLFILDHSIVLCFKSNLMMRVILYQEGFSLFLDFEKLTCDLKNMARSVNPVWMNRDNSLFVIQSTAHTNQIQ